MLWHPYTSLTHPSPVLAVQSAQGCYLTLEEDDGISQSLPPSTAHNTNNNNNTTTTNDRVVLVDGMSSWWSVIHGYRHERLNAAARRQLDGAMSHVMFGGLTHRPAVTLAEVLVATTVTGGAPKHDINKDITTKRNDENNDDDGAGSNQLSKVFLADSGSVSVEVALKMALQYQRGVGRPHKTRFVALQSGYHGDTFGAMSVCDPVNGMHATAFAANLMPHNITLPRPPCDVRYSLSVLPDGSGGENSACHGCTCHRRSVENINNDNENNNNKAQQQPSSTPPYETYEQALEDACRIMEDTLAQHADTTAAVICEPLVQGAGGMRFYDVRYLQRLRAACSAHDVLLICDEIATGFGRASGGGSSSGSGGCSTTAGYLTASAEAGITPDILCLGKALTGGYMTLAAVVTTEDVAQGVSAQPPEPTTNASQQSATGIPQQPPALPLMHGPTFMGNPLACAVAIESIALCMEPTKSSTHDNPQPFYHVAVSRIEQKLRQALQPAVGLPTVADVRVRGAIGVIERKTPLTDMRLVADLCIQHGAWLRPFGRLVYTMPPYIATDEDIDTIAQTMIALAKLE